MSLIVKQIELHLLPGSDLDECARYAKKLSVLLREDVIFRFNGQLLMFGRDGGYSSRPLTEKEMSG